MFTCLLPKAMFFSINVVGHYFNVNFSEKTKSVGLRIDAEGKDERRE